MQVLTRVTKHVASADVMGRRERAGDLMQTGTEAEFSLRFWGVRGSLPVTGPSTLRYGGNTTCMEITAAGRTIIVDCGTGAHWLGKDLLARGIGRADLLMTHTHLDHITGFPLFAPAYSPDFDLVCWACGDAPRPIADTLRSLTAQAIWPLGPVAVDRTEFRTIRSGEGIDLGDGITIRAQRLHHPGGCIGFRIEQGGSAFAIVSDHEHGDDAIDREVAAFVKGADVIVYDATYTDATYGGHEGWGHSTWEKGAALVTQAGAAMVVMFHHAPERTDDELDALVEAAGGRQPGVVAAMEGARVVRLADGYTFAYEEPSLG